MKEEERIMFVLQMILIEQLILLFYVAIDF
jgi:hypothetical protein